MSEDQAILTGAAGDRSSPLRVGGIDYLNAQPLLYELGDGDPPFAVTNHHPSKLASMLRDGELDVALVPVVAYWERPDYMVVPGIGISSYGPVRSIRLYYRRALSDAQLVALDSSSRTSTLLTQLLFREVWGGSPEFTTVEPREARRQLAKSAGAEFDAALLIGDEALSCRAFPDWESVDLGTEWTRWTGLPFVYAFWVCRVPAGPESLPPGLVERFLHARDVGIARIDDIVRSTARPDGMGESDCRNYLAHVILYDLRADMLAGLELFFRKLRETGLAEVGGPLRFLTECVTAAAK